MFRVVDSQEHIEVTSSNVNQIRDEISASDQKRRIAVGQTISHYEIQYDGAQRGDVTVFHTENMGMICLGADSDFGEWDDAARTLTVEYDDADSEVYEL